MSNEDDRLEDALRESESKKDQQVTGSGPPEQPGEIFSLVHLAAAIRNMSHPEQDADTTRTEKRRITDAAKRKQQKQNKRLHSYRKQKIQLQPAKSRHYNNL